MPNREIIHGLGLFMADLPSAEWINAVDGMQAEIDSLHAEVERLQKIVTNADLYRLGAKRDEPLTPAEKEAVSMGCDPGDMLTPEEQEQAYASEIP